MPLSPLSSDDRHRFTSKINQAGSGDCWVWTAGTDRDGYGRFFLNGRKWPAHRVAYLMKTGKTPEVVRHTCDNPSCVNPAHLTGGTQAQNIADRQRRDRQAKGSRNGRAKLDEDLVRELRQRYELEDVSYRDLARELGMDHKTISAAVRGRTWSHVT
jgi:hypothetical protein